MPNIASAFLGAIVGGLLSLVGTWLTLRGRTDYFDDLALRHLSDMLRKDKNTPMSELIGWGKTIGMTETESRQLIFITKSRLGDQVYVDAEIAEKSNTAL